jgi:hypothetical protein
MWDFARKNWKTNIAFQGGRTTRAGSTSLAILFERFGPKLRRFAGLPSFAHRFQFLEFVLPPFHDSGIPSPLMNVGVRLHGGQDCLPCCLTMQTDLVPKRVSVAFPGDPAAGKA